jgi:hypothetical protein
MYQHGCSLRAERPFRDEGARVGAAMDDQKTRAALLDLERRGWNSLCDGSGSQFYGDVMTDDARMVLSNGQIMNRSEVVAALADAPTWVSFELADEQLVSIGNDAAALVYVGTAKRDADGEPYVAAMSSTYRRVGDDWKLALYQQTAVTD